MDPKELYPNYDKDANDPYHDNSQAPQTEGYGYHKPGAAITSMVLGICSVSLWFYPFITSIPCFIMGLVAVLLGRREEGSVDPKHLGFIKAGKITGVLGMIFSVLWTIIFVALIANVARR